MKRKGLLLLCVLVLLAGLGIKLYTDSYVLVAGKSVSRTAKTIDLRDTELSLSDYQKLREALPDCEVQWNIPFQGRLYDNATQELTITALSPEDVAVLGLFQELTLLDATGCTDYDALMDFHASSPDCALIYQVTLGAGSYPQDAREATVADPDIQELKTKLAYLPQLKKLHLTGTLPAYSQLKELMELYPDIDIRWDVTYEGLSLSSTQYYLNLSGIAMDREKIDELLPWFPNVNTVNMRGCGMTDSELMDLADAYPEILFAWDMAFRDLLLPTDAEEIDISGQLMEDTREIEDLLPYFPNVKKVVMSHCGFDDETMDALNNRYEDIRFVWSVQLGDMSLRTDATYFMPVKYDVQVNTEDLKDLRYCTDILCVDIGHMPVANCEWAAYMPNLKYLIIAETQITDITPLKDLKNLVYLELFLTGVTDVSPLLGCTALEDLNMCFVPCIDYKPLLEMTWLKNLWWGGWLMRTYEAEFREALPNTRLCHDSASSTGGGWRELDNYFAMRDLLGMWYMTN